MYPATHEAQAVSQKNTGTPGFQSYFCYFGGDKSYMGHGLFS